MYKYVYVIYIIHVSVWLGGFSYEIFQYHVRGRTFKVKYLSIIPPNTMLASINETVH